MVAEIYQNSKFTYIYKELKGYKDRHLSETDKKFK